MTKRDFAGKVMLISGAAGGLGSALCRRYATAGARIVALDLDARKLEALGAELPPGTLTLSGNIADAGFCRSAIDNAITHFGALDGIINNAGITHRSLLQDTDPEVVRRVMEVNFFGALYLTHAALPQLIANRGVIAVVSSVAGFSPLIGRTGYAASKHALHGFFDSLRSEIEDDGVGITLICPSFIATGIDRAALGAAGGSATSPRVTTGGVSAPDDIAQQLFEAIAGGRRLVRPDATSRLAWWINKLAPSFYARTMKHRVGREFHIGHPSV
jgi:NAD(P)-dependent dehydrogenase (short-subunit alcohol dehydrogenase family)